MAGWKITIFNRRYIFKSLLFPLSCHFFGDVPSLKVTAKAPEKLMVGRLRRLHWRSLFFRGYVRTLGRVVLSSVQLLLVPGAWSVVGARSINPPNFQRSYVFSFKNHRNFFGAKKPQPGETTFFRFSPPQEIAGLIKGFLRDPWWWMIPYRAYYFLGGKLDLLDFWTWWILDKKTSCHGSGWFRGKWWDKYVCISYVYFYMYIHIICYICIL